MSDDPYRSCNIATHVGDDPQTVAANRELLARSLGDCSAADWVTLDQVHGGNAVVVAEHARAVPPADGAVTACAGVPLVVMTADCAPIALFGPGAVGVVHAGWPGLLAGIIGETVALLRQAGAGDPLHACLGPCIRPESYEFGPHDLEQFVTRFGERAVGRTRWGSPALDIPELVRLQLSGAGVDSFEDSGICTFADRNCFSHRRDGRTGRQGLVVVRAASAGREAE